ncbi:MULTISPECIES: hypothetical protein [Aurantimonas]|uniref:hypothetical protein n=1 Tax=Aurantimonas TaxID=182269 RepID=UPI00351455EB
MPTLRNPRHEAFARGLAEGRTADDAYVFAGFKANRGNATRLKANDSVMKRVRELQERSAEKAEWTAADRLRMLAEIADRSAQGDPRVAVSAIAEANKMQGSHAPARHQHAGANGGPIQTIDVTKLKGMTDQELEALERALVQIGIVDGDPGGEGREED